MVVFGSILQKGSNVTADGLISDKCNQNLWVYTADCIPILFADKRTRKVAALHCGRKGLEKKIIKNLVEIFDNLGSSRDNLLVAIGPSISKEFYLVDKKTLIEFYIKVENQKLSAEFTKNGKNSNFNYFNNLKEKNLNQIDLEKVAYRQLLNE